MKLGLTIFPSIFDNRTHRLMVFDGWDDLVQLLTGLSRQPGYKPKKGERVDFASPLITPAVFEKNSTRANKAVISWAGWAALDVDEFPEGYTLEKALEVFSPYQYLCYSSASSTKEKPKFRVVLRLAEHVPAAKIRHFWLALNKEFAGLADAQTKDLSRMYYVPAQYPNAYNFIFHHQSGQILSPSTLMEKHPTLEKPEAKFSDEILAKLAEYKSSKLSKKFSWSSYRDCPFVNQRLVAEYRAITSTGWYHQMYRIMTSIACSAIKRGHAITPEEVAGLCSEIDSETGGWYKTRPMREEALRAINFALRA